MQNERVGVDQVSQPKVSAFELFGLPLRFHLNLDDLEEAYYTASRQAHPDQVAGKEDLMQTLNEAFESLKDPEKRAGIILAFYKVETSRVDIPHTIAEAWFDLKVDPVPRLVAEFEASLEQVWEQMESALDSYWSQFDAQGEVSVLKPIARLMAKRSYLKALRKDLLIVKGMIAT